MSTLERDLTKVKDSLSDINDDFKNLHRELHEIRRTHSEYEEETNKDIGSVKGSCKYSEDQINLVKKMIQRLADQTKNRS